MSGMFDKFFGPPAPRTPGEAAMQQAGMGRGGPPASTPGGGGKGKGGGEEPYEGSGFDPRGFERAAKATKVLDASPNSKDALAVIREQERTKQAQHAVQSTNYEAYMSKMALERIAQEAEEQRKTLGAQAQHNKEQAQYVDELERKRYVEKLQAQQQLHERELRRQEELARRQEEMRRKTIAQEAELRQKTELARVEEETKGRIKQERQNHDLRLEQAHVEAAEHRQTVLDGIKLAGETLGAGARAFLSDRDKMIAATATLSAIALGIYSARTGTAVAGRYIEARLGKPSLIRETSRTSPLHAVRHPVQAGRRLLADLGLLGKPSDALSGVVLEPKLADRLGRVAVSTHNTKRNKAPFRHLLLYGPPGTGKTMFAKGLARHSGLEYAIMTGGDVAPLGRDAVTEIHKVFEWSKTSRRGLLLFIDEADAFLRKRSTEQISEDLRNALNAFLHCTGEPTDKFMLVYASNQPEQFDWAVNDRIDEMVEIGLPGLEERERMIGLYIDKYLRSSGGGVASGARRILCEDIDDELVRKLAGETDGFSGREIAKLAIAWQAAAYGSVDTTINPALMDLVLANHVEQKKLKRAWNTAASITK